MIKNNKVLSTLVMLMFLVMMTACGTKFFSETGQQLPPGLGYAVQAAEQANTLYDATMTTAGKMHCDKKITDATAWKIIKVMRVYKTSIDVLQVGVKEWKAAIADKTDTEAPKYATYLRLIGLAKDVIPIVNDVNAMLGKNFKIPEFLNEDAIQAVFGEVK